MSIADNIIILDQHNSLMHKKSCFKTFAELFSALKDKQYAFKADIINSIDFTTADSIMQFIKMLINALSDNSSTMMISDLITHKLLEFK